MARWDQARLVGAVSRGEPPARLAADLPVPTQALRFGSSRGFVVAYSSPHARGRIKSNRRYVSSHTRNSSCKLQSKNSVLRRTNGNSSEPQAKDSRVARRHL